MPNSKPAAAVGRRCTPLPGAATGSIGSVGDALDNALMESAIGLYKTEVIDRHPRSWNAWREVETHTASWVHWYNTSRLHSTIGYVPPAEYEHDYHHQTTRHRDLAAA